MNTVRADAESLRLARSGSVNHTRIYSFVNARLGKKTSPCCSGLTISSLLVKLYVALLGKKTFPMLL